MDSLDLPDTMEHRDRLDSQEKLDFVVLPDRTDSPARLARRETTACLATALLDSLERRVCLESLASRAAPETLEFLERKACPASPV